MAKQKHQVLKAHVRENLLRLARRLRLRQVSIFSVLTYP